MMMLVLLTVHKLEDWRDMDWQPSNQLCCALKCLVTREANIKAGRFLRMHPTYS